MPSARTSAKFNWLHQIKIMNQSDIILYNILQDIIKLHSQKCISLYISVLSDGMNFALSEYKNSHYSVANFNRINFIVFE